MSVALCINVKSHDSSPTTLIQTKYSTITPKCCSIGVSVQVIVNSIADCAVALRLAGAPGPVDNMIKLCTCILAIYYQLNLLFAAVRSVIVLLG